MDVGTLVYGMNTRYVGIVVEAKPDNVSSIYYFGDKEFNDQQNVNLVEFISYPQVGTDPIITTRQWMSSIFECLFLKRIPNLLDRIFILRNYDKKNSSYSEEWLTDDAQDNQFSFKQKHYLAAYSNFKTSKDYLTPIWTDEKLEWQLQKVQKLTKDLTRYQEYIMKCQEDEQKILYASSQKELRKELEELRKELEELEKKFKLAQEQLKSAQEQLKSAQEQLKSAQEQLKSAQVNHREEIAAKDLKIAAKDLALEQMQVKLKDREKRLHDIEILDKETIAKRA